MVDAWLTTMSTNLEAVINPLIAACEEGFLPDELYVLENPGVGDQFDDITSMMERVVVEYGGEDPDLSVTHLEMETDFQESSSTSVNRLPRYRPTGVRRRSTSPRSKVHVGDRVPSGDSVRGRPRLLSLCIEQPLLRPIVPRCPQTSCRTR